MEPAAMVRCAHTLLRALKEDLAEAKSVAPTFILLLDCGCDFIAYDNVLLNSPAGRAAIAESLRGKAIQTGARGVLIGMDSYAFVPNVQAITTAHEKLVRAAAAAGIDAMVRSGFGRKSEAISITLQTSAFHVLLQQLYTRGDGNSIVFGELRTTDSRECHQAPVIATGLFNVFSPRQTNRT
jgi:hypothetical protein